MSKTRAYTVNHPEQIFNITYTPGEVPQDELADIKSREIKGYRVKTTIAGPYVESEVYPIWKRSCSVPRAKKGKPSRKEQAALNEKNAIKKIVRLANVNFGKRDIWATFTYDDEHLPSSLEEAGRNMQNYIRRVKRARERLGLPPLKYIYVTEYLEPTEKHPGTRYHHHVIMSGGISRDTIEEMWTCGGRKQSRRLQPDDYGITGLATYITKAPQNGGHRWAASKNLLLPREIRADTKTTKSRVFAAAHDYEQLRRYFQELYPKYDITDIAPPAFNDINGGAYLYARMRRRVA